MPFGHPASSQLPAASPLLSDTHERLLDAAEELFAEHGFAEASLRQITVRAGANLAAVNYHFGSKEGLYQQVFLRRLQPMNVDRRQRLDELESCPDSPAVRDVLDVLLRPIVELATSRWPDRHPFVRTMVRNLVEPPPFMAHVVQREVGPILQRVGALLQRALPQLDEATLLFRLRYMIGATNMTFAAVPFLPPIRDTSGTALPPHDQLRHLMQMCEAVLCAPPPPTNTDGKPLVDR